MQIFIIIKVKIIEKLLKKCWHKYNTVIILRSSQRINIENINNEKYVDNRYKWW